jgi:hypothetical protein
MSSFIPYKAFPAENAVATLNYLRKSAKGNDISGGRPLIEWGSHNPGPVFRRWKSEGEYRPTNLYSTKAPGMIEAHDGEKPALAILLSNNLAYRLQRAMVIGRNHRTAENKAILRIKELEAQIEKVNSPEVWTINGAEIRKLEDEIDEGAIALAHIWREANELLDMVWVKAVISAPKEKEVYENEWERRNRERKSRDQAHNNRSGEHESREHILTHLNELATKAQILIKARDRFDSHCHDWKRRSRDYLENQRKHDQREPAEIQQEFRRIFEEEVALDRASVLGAREAYLNAQSRAKKAGISDRCLGYVESIDLHSEDSEEIRKADRSALKEVPRRLNRPRGYVIDRELYPPAHRVKDWINNVKFVGSVPGRQARPSIFS